MATHHPLNTPNPSAVALMELVTLYRRRDVYAELQRHGTRSEAALVDGAIAEQLGKAARPGRVGRSEVNKVLDEAAGFDGRVVGWFDEEYPEAWRHIPDPPLVYFTRGTELAQLAQRCRMVAMVGARKASDYGRSVTAEIAGNLTRHGCVVVSGLAYGIDAAAHRGCLHAGGQTIAVLGGGLNKIYPASHRSLARQIVTSGGCLVSEYPPGTAPRPHHFLERNRLISGLCPIVVVVEAALRSGALNTARWASEQGREVFAVPGNLRNPLAAGCHQLIAQGARIVCSSSDILGPDVDDASHCEPEPAVSVSSDAQKIIDLCLVQPTSLDELLLELDSAIGYTQLTTLLGELEVLGIVESTPLGYIATSKK